MNKALMVALTCLTGIHAHATDKELMDHLPLWSFFSLASRDTSIACGTESTNIFLEEVSGSSTGRNSAISIFERCVEEKAVPRMEASYIQAAKYLRENGLLSAMPPLRSYYLKKAVVFKSEVPAVGETESDKKARHQRSTLLNLEAEQLKKEVELEIKM